MSRAAFHYELAHGPTICAYVSILCSIYSYLYKQYVRFPL